MKTISSLGPCVRALSALACATATTLCVSAKASEVNTYCQLVQAQARTSSSLLASPELFGNAGDPVSAQPSTSVGVRHSLVRSRQARLTDQMALAECNAYRAESELTDQVSRAETRAELLSILRTEDKWKHALTVAQKNLQIEQRLLLAQQSRLADVKAAFDQVDLVRREIATASARKARAESLLTESEESIPQLLDRAVNARAKVSELAAELNRATAWDLTYAAGLRADMNSGSKKGFVAVTASWNLGQAESERASARVAELSAQWQREKHDGQTQSFERAKDTIEGLIAAGQQSIESFQARQDLLKTALARLADVSTTNGERAKRAMKIEQYILHAQAVGIQTQVDYLRDWMSRNAR